MTTITYEQYQNYEYCEHPGQILGYDVEIKTVEFRDETEYDMECINEYLIGLVECVNVGKVWVENKTVDLSYIQKC